MTEKRFKRVCTCEKCGNEAEMMITCSLEPDEAEAVTRSQESRLSERQSAGRTRAHAVCSHCGSEADMWLDM